MQAQGRRTQPVVSVSAPTVVPGSSYRFLVRSAEEAVGAIRSQLGGEARVVSVRSVKAPGLSGLIGGSRLEVIAQIPSAAESSKDGSAQAVAQPVIAQGAESAAVSMPVPAMALAGGRESIGRGASEEWRGGTARVNGSAPRIDTLLRRAGLSEPLIVRFCEAADLGEGPAQPLHRELTEVARQIRVMADGLNSRPLSARTAFLGMAGVGRTTALCKWLSAEVFSRGRSGAVASIEFDRPNSAECLGVYAEMLGLDFSRVPPPPGSGNSFCYFDLPPISLTRPEENRKIQQFLDEQRVTGRVLVLSCLCDAALLRHACTVAQDIGCTHLVFTQLDELPQWGKLWDFLLETPFAPLMLSTGPSLSGEWETDVVGAVLRRTFPWN